MSQASHESGAFCASDKGLKISSTRRSRPSPPRLRVDALLLMMITTLVLVMLLLMVAPGCQTDVGRASPSGTPSAGDFHRGRRMDPVPHPKPGEFQVPVKTVEAEQDWFDAHEAWKDDVQTLTSRLLQELSDENATQIRLLRRLHSDGAYLQSLRVYLAQYPPAELDAGLILSLQDLEYRWAMLEERLSNLADSESAVTGSAGDRITP